MYKRTVISVWFLRVKPLFERYSSPRFTKTPKLLPLEVVVEKSKVTFSVESVVAKLLRLTRPWFKASLWSSLPWANTKRAARSKMQMFLDIVVFFEFRKYL